MRSLPVIWARSAPPCCGSRWRGRACRWTTTGTAAACCMTRRGRMCRPAAAEPGCSAAVLCCKILPMLAAGQLRRVLFLATGALMSQTTFFAGESIPGIAHCVELGGAV